MANLLSHRRVRRAFFVGFATGVSLFGGGLFLSQPHPAELKLQDVCQLHRSTHGHCRGVYQSG